MLSTGDDAKAATVIITEHVRTGCEDQYRAWQAKLNDAASAFPGFLGVETDPPSDEAGDWTVVYRFDSVSNLQAWLNSRSRQELLNEGSEFKTSPPSQQVIVGANVPDELATVVVTHRVAPDEEEEFVAWQREMTAAENQFEGFEGSELFRPVPGVQQEWTAVYRFASAENLRRWLGSEERRRLLSEHPRFSDFELRTISSRFGSWFGDGRDSEQVNEPGRLKTSIAVYVGLYPTVMLLTLVITKLLPGVELWQSLLVGNLVSSFVMTYVTMPHYVNRVLRPWLTAEDDAPQPATNLKWLTLSALTIGAWALVFWLFTTQIWTLP